MQNFTGNPNFHAKLTTYMQKVGKKTKILNFYMCKTVKLLKLDTLKADLGKNRTPGVLRVIRRPPDRLEPIYTNIYLYIPIYTYITTIY